jgi:hypothetical protein
MKLNKTTEAKLNRAVAKLNRAVVFFDLAEAEKVSDSLHDFESSGGQLTKIQERKWSDLTNKIEAAKLKK